MDPRAQASFIPKKPVVGGAAAAVAGGGVIWLVSLFIFVASLIAAGSVFAYQRYLQSHIDSESASLAKAQAAFDPSAITDLVRLDDRLNQSKNLMNNHVSPSQLFAYLEQNTLQNVRFDSLAYQTNADGQIVLSLSGSATDFSSVALQSDQFGKSRALHNVLFSDVNTDLTTGGVIFKVTATVDPALVSYRNMITGSGGLVSPVPVGTQQ